MLGLHLAIWRRRVKCRCNVAATIRRTSACAACTPLQVPTAHRIEQPVNTLFEIAAFHSVERNCRGENPLRRTRCRVFLHRLSHSDCQLPIRTPVQGLVNPLLSNSVSW